ncbi:uncharacterized protein B0I36DRAFT_379707 [Microdochium trichocladiopsis]|uniref:F-box domain-containing protein n=1 Tax=Microdochium trichocladiopsis TaxID=1682393 RepID=A0A9P8YFI3_9PEZI|nr:uncharacterized protein B0I36DRAFT_379707 [Microdochium trichocladiopsis]KAH7040817.1 hypothetical protein B0I36DRAFT_379707 [Microdochium trichocladiopsis]
MDTALAIPELLEAILLHLDTRTLLVAAQRTSTTWHSLIKTSPGLQKALFLQPDASIPPSAPLFNQLLVDTFPFCFQQLHNQHKHQHKHQQPDLPLQQPISRSKDASALNATPFPASPHITSRKHAFARPEASWRRMLIQQPPLRSYGVVMTACVPSSTTRAPGTRGETADPSPDDGAASPPPPPRGRHYQAQEILLMPSPTLSSQQQREDEDDDASVIISMPFLLEKCLTAPQQPARGSGGGDDDDQDVPISGFRVFWNAGGSGKDTVEAAAAAAAAAAATATASFPGEEREQVRSAVTYQAQQHRMVLNAVIGLAKLSPPDAELRRVRDVLLDGDYEILGGKPCTLEGAAGSCASHSNTHDECSDVEI